MSGRKGQFFMLGAIAISVLFFIGLPKGVSPGSGQTADLEALGENLEREYPRAVNTILLERDPPSRIGEFLEFVRDSSGSRYMEIEMLSIVLVPDPSSPGEVTANLANWLGSQELVEVEIGGSVRSLNLNDQETGSLSFSGVSRDMDVRVSWTGKSWNLAFPRDKTNAALLLRITRGENVLVREIAG